MKYLLISLSGLFCLWCLVNLWNMWQADISFAYGKNLDSVSHYTNAYPYLKSAVDQNPDEPTFRDELSFNEAVLATASMNSATDSAKILLDRAISNSNAVVEASPNTMTFWKTRTRVFYQLGSIDPKYYLTALEAISTAANLAPTDAKVHYNLGVILSKVGKIDQAIKILEETTILKPDYGDAYYATALLYDQQKNIPKARQQMELILKNVGPDERAQKWLEENK